MTDTAEEPLWDREKAIRTILDLREVAAHLVSEAAANGLPAPPTSARAIAQCDRMLARFGVEAPDRSDIE